VASGPRELEARPEEQVKNALFRGLFGAFGTSSSFSSRTMSMDVSTQIAHHGFDVAADVATSVYFEASTFTNGHRGQPREAPPRFPSCRLRSGRSYRMFLEVHLPPSRAGFLPADTVAQSDGNRALAAACPTMYLSNSTTIHAASTRRTMAGAG